MDQFLSDSERRAFRMAVIATGNRDDALEIVQDAMIKLVNKYADRGPEQWGPLFHRILQTTIRDWYRRTKVRNSIRQFFSGASDEQYGDVMDSYRMTKQYEPDVQLGHEQAMATLEHALHRLPLRQQQAFLLRQWQGLDVAATANAMGCSEGSVKTHLSRATRTLREKLAGHQL